MFKRNKQDKLQKEITHCLKLLGYSVWDTSQIGNGFPDIIVGANGINYLFEIKSKHTTISKSQCKFDSEWKGNSQIIYSVSDALQIIEKND